MSAQKSGGKKIIAQNKKAYHDYFVDEKYEAGIALYGTEVKSVRAGTVNLKDSYCTIRGGELFALGIHVSPYEKGNIFNRDPLREKKLLMHKKEILKLFNLVGQVNFEDRESLMFFQRVLLKSGTIDKLREAGCRDGDTVSMYDFEFDFVG